MARKEYKVGSKVTLANGSKVQVTAVNADGTANYSELNPATKKPFPFGKGSHGKLPAMNFEGFDATGIAEEFDTDASDIEISFDEEIYTLAEDLDSIVRSTEKDALKINALSNDVYDHFMKLDYVDRQTFLDAISFNQFESLTESLDEEKRNRFMVANIFSDKVYEKSISSLVEAAFFTDGEELDPVAELAPESKDLLKKDFNKFVSDNILIVAEATQKDSGYHAENLAHDFWLTRNHHGAGFWDRDQLKSYGIADALTEAASKFREVSLVTGDDRHIYVE